MTRGPAGPLGSDSPGAENGPPLEGYLPPEAGDVGATVGMRSTASLLRMVTPDGELPCRRGMLLPVGYSFSAAGSLEAVFDSMAQPAARKHTASRERGKFFFMLGGMGR